MIEWLPWLLVPVAAWGGWRLSGQTVRWSLRRQNRAFSDQYFQGLNYLLNEQPDKAIEVFLELAEVTRDTVETHLALGNLFRRRGEVDRAIRIHQNIIAKSSLTDEQRTQALLELGEDYMRAGLLDRAEKLFSELVDRESLAPTALEHLLDIYQQEKDWERSLDMAEKLEQVTGRRMGKIMAHFCCEQAAVAKTAGDQEAARKLLGQARRHDPESTRIRLMMAESASEAGDHVGAMSLYEEVAELDSGFIPTILDPYMAAADAAADRARALSHIDSWAESYDGVSLTLARTAALEASEGPDAAARLLVDVLGQRPTVRGLDRLIELKLAGALAADASDEILRRVASRLLSRQPDFRCTNCGFSGHTHHWQCPSCRKWGTTRNIRGVLAE